jgi:hypothetical protein
MPGIIWAIHNPKNNGKREAPLFLDAGGLEAVSLKVRRFFTPIGQ